MTGSFDQLEDKRRRDTGRSDDTASLGAEEGRGNERSDQKDEADTEERLLHADRVEGLDSSFAEDRVESETEAKKTTETTVGRETRSSAFNFARFQVWLCSRRRNVRRGCHTCTAADCIVNV